MAKRRKYRESALSIALTLALLFTAGSFYFGGPRQLVATIYEWGRTRNVNSLGGFEAACASFTSGTLIIADTQTVSADTVVPSGVRLHFQAPGNLAMASGKKVTVTDGPAAIIAPPDLQIISGAGTVEWGAGGEMWANWLGLVPRLFDFADENAVALQAAFDAAYPKGINVRIWAGTYYYDTTLLQRGSNLHFSGVGSWQPDLEAAKDTNYGTRLVYTGVGTGFANATPTTRLFNLQIHDIAFACNNESNAGYGLDITSINYFDIQRVTVSYFGGYGMRVQASTDSGIANCLARDIKITRTDGGLWVNGNGDGSTGMVADTTFQDIMVRDIQVAGGGATTNWLFYLEKSITKCRFDGLSYKQAVTMPIGGAIHKGDTYKNILINCGGEIGAQAVPELNLVASTGASFDTIINPKLQDATKLIRNAGNKDTIISAHHPYSSSPAWHYTSYQFYVTNPAAGQAYNANQASLLGDANVTSILTPYAGAVVGLSVKRWGGGADTGPGYCNFRPAVAGTYISNGPVAGLGAAGGYNTDEQVSATQTTNTGTAAFAAGVNLGVTYASHASWNGTGTYVVTMLVCFKPTVLQ